jgi:hypothetical protein
MSAPSGGDRPWRGAWREHRCESARRMMLFEDGEACAKGTALVAKARTGAPRPRFVARRGSSGGRAAVTSSSPMISGRTARNPRNGAECSSARSRADESVRVVETAQAHPAGVGYPARAANDHRSFVARTLRAVGDVEGDRNPMRGGCTHWVVCAAKRRRWMSTGRPRAEC